MKTRLRADLRVSMRARHALDTRVIRTLLAALDNAEAVSIEAARSGSRQRFPGHSAEVARRDLADADVQALLREEVDSRLRAADDLDGYRQHDRAAALRAEAAIARGYVD